MRDGALRVDAVQVLGVLPRAPLAPRLLLQRRVANVVSVAEVGRKCQLERTG